MKSVHEPDVELLSAEDALMDVSKLTVAIDRQNAEKSLYDILVRLNIHENLRDRINSFKVLLCKLLAREEHSWKKLNWRLVPSNPGVYLIIEGGDYLYVGQAGNGKSNLRVRLQKHDNGKLNYDTFNKKLYQVMGMQTEIERINFVLNKCSFKFIETGENDKERYNFEHFVIATLNPRLNDNSINDLQSNIKSQQSSIPKKQSEVENQTTKPKKVQEHQPVKITI